MSEPSLKELRIVLAVAAAGSFRQAAQRLDLAPSTLSHAVTELERALNLRIFHRTTRSLAPTTEGEAFLKRVTPLITELDAVLAAPSSDPGAVGGALRINMPFAVVTQLLESVVPGFLERYPLIELDLRHEERLVDIVAEGCDAGVRLGRTVAPNMIGVPLGTPMRWALVASPGYLDRQGVPDHPRQLAQHRCLRTRLPNGARYAWEFERDGEEFALDVPGPLTLDRMVLAIEAARLGLGIAYVLREAVAADIRAGSLRELLPEWMPGEDGYMLYYPGRKVLPRPLRAFIDFLREKDGR